MDSFGMGNVTVRGSIPCSRDGTATEAAGAAELTPSGGRRNSFLYRSTDSLTNISPMSLSRKVSAASGDVSVLTNYNCVYLSSSSTLKVARNATYKKTKLK